MSLPSITTKFTLGPEITDEQRAFLAEHGFLHFRGVAKPEEVEMLRSERDRLETKWLDEGRTSVNGIPLFTGRNEHGERILQRMAFTSQHSDGIKDFVTSDRFEPVRLLVGEDARVGHAEKDGVVINRYLNVPGNPYRKLGWHTDGLRDLFYLRMPQQMLNFGVHLDHVTEADGGLRLIPGSHRQGFADMLFRKLYFISHAPDAQEITVETEPGDLTVHDGRLWHRVEQSSQSGAASIRRTMYVPFLRGPYEPKTEQSKTPTYHYLSRIMLAVRGRKQALAFKLGLIKPPAARLKA